jgi:hypothetical protein
MSVNEYVTKFTQLSRYAPFEVDTDEKKQECFLNGLNDGLAYALEARDFENFQGMVNKALMLENHRGVMERKRRLGHQQQLGSSTRPRVAMPSAGPVFRPAQPLFQPRPQVAGQGYSTPQRQAMPRPSTSQTPIAGNQNVQRTQATQNPLPGEQRCFAYGEKCHFANQCSNPRNRPPLATASTPVTTREANFVPVAARQNFIHEKSIMSQLRKPRKLRTWSLVRFPSTTSLQLCCLILKHHILSYLLHMLRSIIYPWPC